MLVFEVARFAVHSPSESREFPRLLTKLAVLTPNHLHPMFAQTEKSTGALNLHKFPNDSIRSPISDLR